MESKQKTPDRRLKLGILFMPEDPPNGARIEQRWEEIVDLAVAAEQAGFDGCFLPEHHFMADGFCTSPLLALATIAARTKTLKLGTSILMLPCYNPIRLAEEGALLDILSHGRLILGIGLGNLASELSVYGVSRKEQVSRFEETLEVVRRAWSEEEFSFAGRHYSYSSLKVTPRPVQRPCPPIWMGAMSEAGLKRAGRVGLPWLTDPLHNINVIRYWADLYRTASAARNYPPSVVLIRDGWVGESMDEVERIWWPHAQQDHWRYVNELPRWVAGMEPWLSEVHRIEDFAFERHRAERLVVGSPEEVTTTLQHFARTVSTDYIIMRMRLATGPNYEETMRCIRLFGQFVIPSLSSGAIEGATQVARA